MKNPFEVIQSWLLHNTNDFRRSVKTIVTHKGCPDGIASAMILKNALPNASVVFVQYGTDLHKTLPAEPGMLFCDMTPPAERVAEFVDAGAFVMDHHKYARSVVEAFGERGAYADEKEHPGASGASLAYELWLIMSRFDSDELRKICLLDIGEFARLAAIRDTWQTGSDSWVRACEQASVLVTLGEEWFLNKRGSNQPFLTVPEKLLGRLFYERTLRQAKETAERVHIYEHICQGLRVAVMNDTRTSDVAEAFRATGREADLLVGYRYENPERAGESPRLVFSLRPLRDGIDVGLMAKSMNGPRMTGGGHSKAAGFSLTVKGMFHQEWPVLVDAVCGGIELAQGNAPPDNPRH